MYFCPLQKKNICPAALHKMKQKLLRISGSLLLILSLLPLCYAQNRNDAPAFYSSNLPIILINTNGQGIPDEPKIMADFQVIYNGPGLRNYLTDEPDYSGKIGIEIRGSSSQNFPKKSYGFELWNDMGLEIDTNLLGMPKESDWILNANYTDKTFCRNTLAYAVSQQMGHYATRFRYVEVMINNSYMGIYILSEKIKRDNHRVDIADLNPDDNTGDQLTGGYIIKIDKSTGSGGDGWLSFFPPPAHPNDQYIYFQYDYPSQYVLTSQQKQYIQGFMYNFEKSLSNLNFADTAYGYRKWMNVESFIDYFIVNEISKNVDGYRLSTFLYKDRDSNDPKLHIGPVWDYDIAWHNADYCDGEFFWGWAYQFPCAGDWWQVPFWWNRLLEDTNYNNELKCRWLTLRQSFLSNNGMDNYIDSVASLLDEAQVRNFQKWPILGQYVWPNPYPIPQTYAEEIDVLKTWIHNRMYWLDSNMPGYCDCTDAKQPENYKIVAETYPNPAIDYINIRMPSELSVNTMLTLVNIDGKIMSNEKATVNSNNEIFKDISLLPSGFYLARITDGKQQFLAKFVKN